MSRALNYHRRVAASSKLQIQVRHHDGVSFVTLSGTMDEGSDLTPITGDLLPTTVVDLSDIERITSPGIRDWGHFIEAAEARGVKFLMVRCCPVVVEQINLVRGFLGRGVVKSLYAPYTCSRCGMEQRLLLECRQISHYKAPSFNCPRCNEPMIFDSIEDSYFGFLKDPKKVVTDDSFDAIVPPQATPVEEPPLPAMVPAVPAPTSDSVPSNPSLHEIPPFAPPEPGTGAAVVQPAPPRSTMWMVWLVVAITVASALAWLL